MKKKIIKKSSQEQVWNNNTDLCVDVKTTLYSDRSTKIGKSYPGQLTRDTEDHYSFVETISLSAGKRNPQIYVGRFITVTLKDDGSYRPNFRPMKVDKDFSVERYALGVSNELLWALEGLVENGLVENENK